MIKMHFTIISLFFCLDLIRAQSLCGDWVAYRDVKCFQIFESSGLQTYDDASNTCRGNNNNSNLVTINNLDEQNFLETFIFNTSKIVDNVWIGAQYVNSHYQWLNGLSLTYTNWAEGYPKNLTDNCVEMYSDAVSVGKWIEASCKRKNLVVCQKLPNWSQTHIQEIILSLQQTVNSLKQTLIPIGFIYVQFPNEKIPHDIWPWMTWQEITSSYAGLFFRAFGGNSSSFGSTQEASSPGITKVQTELLSAHSSAGNTYGLVNMTEGEWSKWIGTAGWSGEWADIRFFTESSEVRPRNTAIRIWKRYA